MNLPNQSDNDRITGINVTPLVDVSLVLVLVFMVSTPFFEKTLMQVSLPQAVSSTSEDQKNITVSISAEEGFAVNDVITPKKVLALQLKKQRKETGFDFLLIRADEKVPYGEVEDVMKTGKEAGYKRIAFATVPKGW